MCAGASWQKVACQVFRLFVGAGAVKLPSDTVNDMQAKSMAVEIGICLPESVLCYGSAAWSSQGSRCLRSLAARR